MDKVLEALDYLEDRISQILRGKPVRDLDEAVVHLRSLLSAPVASDAREPGNGAVEIAAEIQRQIDEWIAGPNDGRTFQSIAARLIESSLREAYHAGLANMSDNFSATIAERERKAREEERESLVKLIWDHPHVFYQGGAKCLKLSHIEDLLTGAKDA